MLNRIKLILILNGIIAILTIVALVVLGYETYMFSIIVGTLTGMVNLALLARMLQSFVDDTKPRNLIFRFLLKYGTLGILIALAFFVLDVDPLGFAAGFTTTVFSIIIGGLVGAVVDR